MNAKTNTLADAAELRRRAEARLRERRKIPRSAAGDPKSAGDTQRLLHELQVHKVELEMQNAELQAARDAAEEALEKYADLYDFAPVGYFSLDEQGRILEVNLTGAAFLGVERSRLLNRRLRSSMATTSQPVFLAFLEKVFAGAGRQVCEVAFLRAGGTVTWANLHGAFAISIGSPRKWCRLTVSDITALKRAEEAHRRIEDLKVTNLELKGEIVRRQAVEEALRLSQQHQGQLLAQSHHLQEELRHLSRQVLQAQEEERKRISRELHDEITQTLVSIHVHLAALACEAQVNPKDLKKKIARTQRLVEKSMNIVHQFARELRPSLLDDLGLIVTLHSLMKDFAKRTGIRVQFTAFAGVEKMASAKRTVLYRVVQSALANVAQHARASRVKVSIRKLADIVCMEINDNGKSFDVERVLHAKGNMHLGLLGMRERVAMVSGRFSVESTPGQGTTIRAEIPFGESPARGKAKEAR